MTEQQAERVVDLLIAIEERLLRIEAAIRRDPELRARSGDGARLRGRPLRVVGRETA